MADGLTLWRYRRAFRLGSVRGLVTLRSRIDGLASELRLDDRVVAVDHTPLGGTEALRNHLLVATLPDGARLEIEAGWISAFNTGLTVRKDGVLVHQSHPGRTIAYPEKYREAARALQDASLGQALQSGLKDGWNEAGKDSQLDLQAFKRNRVPLAVDIGLGLLFFIVAKLTDLTTAALVGAGAGVALLIVQRFTRIDLLGGLALFGIAMLLLSAGLALAFQSDDAVKYRSSIVGLISATLFLVDGMAGGNRLAARLKRYLPYRGIDPARLGIGMGVLGAVMAAVNFAVAELTSTDFWLFYSTFADFGLSILLIMLVFRYAQGKLLRDFAPRYRTEDR